jgi:hypothetical protein
MPDLSALAPIMTSAVALMGALVAGLSVYFTYRERHNQFRQVVYGRQMDAYFDITEAMSNLYTAAQNILAAGNPWLKAEDARARFRLLQPRPHLAASHLDKGQRYPGDNTDGEDRVHTGAPAGILIRELALPLP